MNLNQQSHFQVGVPWYVCATGILYVKEPS